MDLLRVFDRQLITGAPNGLKRVAALAGYSWEVDRGDTEATAALREWLDHAATGCPSVESLDPPARLGLTR